MTGINNSQELKWDALTKISTTAIKWTGIAAIGHQASKAVIALSDSTTITDISVSLAADINKGGGCIVPWVLGCIIAFFGVRYGNHQRKLRLEKTNQMSDNLNEMGLMLDPSKSSSELTTTGETPNQREFD